MTMNFSIHQYEWNQSIEAKIISDNHQYLNWPLVYFLESSQASSLKEYEAYVGETTDVLNRLKTHSKSERKRKLNSLKLIVSDLFNKSAALDIEANLIRYISADGKYTLQNGNLGISNHKFYQQKEVYWELFRNVWSELRKLGITKHSLKHIDNSDLFKYSPYKSLSKGQINGLKTILKCILDDNAKISLIEGGAGTGKSILAIFLFKLLKTNLSDFNFSDFEEEDEEVFDLLKKVKHKYGDLNMALVIPMSSFRKTISKVFRNIKGLSANMVIGPSEVVKREYDLLIVDEGHRLRRRVNLGTYYSVFDNNCKSLGLDEKKATELDWIKIKSKKSIIFYDQLQSIKPSDISYEDFNNLKYEDFTRTEKLIKQFRVKGGEKYVEFIDLLFTRKPKPYSLNLGLYDFRLFDNLEEMVEQIRKKETTNGLSRMVAGFAWEWVSKNDPEKYDIIINDTKLKWNKVTEDWVNSPNASNEVGCIHTTQGYDLNYTGVIIGPELDYDFDKKKFIVYKELYKDKNGKNSIKDERVLLEYILNIYRTIFLRGIEGTYVYVCNSNLRKYFSEIIPLFRSCTNSKLPFNILSVPNKHAVPYYEIKTGVKNFIEYISLGINQYIEIPHLNKSENYFACKMLGESMNTIIPNGSICLFKKHSEDTLNGQITLVESNEILDTELGGNYTIKEYSIKQSVDEDGWKSQEIILKPLSTEKFESIVLRDEQTSNVKVIGVFEMVLG